MISQINHSMNMCKCLYLLLFLSALKVHRCSYVVSIYIVKLGLFIRGYNHFSGLDSVRGAISENFVTISKNEST